MTKEEALNLIDNHKNKLVNPVEMLGWTWLRVLVLSITNEEWQELLRRADPILRK